MNTKDLYKLFEEFIEIPDDFTNIKWYVDGFSLVYNLQNNMKDLKSQTGETYCVYIWNRRYKDEYVMFELDHNCGATFQAIFKTENEVKFDD